MNQAKIPYDFRWMTPIVETLVEQYSRNPPEIFLSEAIRFEFSRRFTTEMRRSLELWIGLTKSEEASMFNMGMIVLDGLRLLKETEPTLNFDFWHSQLSSPLWGEVRRAVQMINEDHLANLSKQERTTLDGHVEKLLKSVTNANSRIWLTWLRCRIDKTLDIGREFLRKLIDSSPNEGDKEFDLGDDACCALVSLPHVSQDDIDCVMRFIQKTEIDEYTAAVALGALLRSEFVPRQVKVHARKLARKSKRDALIEVLDDEAD